MAKPCSICFSVDVAGINAAMISRASYREIARRFSVSRSAIGRHRTHVTEATVKAESSEDVLDQIQRWSEEAVEVVGQLLSRQPTAAGRITRRKTASRRRQTVFKGSKTS